MATISTAVRLNDMITGPLMNITNALNMTVAAFDELDAAANVDVGAIRGEIASAGAGLRQMQEQMSMVEQSAQRQVGIFDNLKGKIVAMAGAYAGMQGAELAIGVSDELALTTARLDLMNDGLQTTQELQDMIFNSAQNARGSYSDMAQNVAKLGILAGDAFSSNAETVMFAEQLQKQFALGGAAVSEQTAGMYQLTQAMAAGKLQGDEFRSIMENAPLLAQAIADQMGKTKGELKEMSSQGVITADIIKSAVFGAAEETNAKFESMPMTFGQIWQSITNEAMMAFQPVLTRMNDIANSENFDKMVTGLIGGMTTVATVAAWTFDVMTAGVGFVVDNWSLIEPVIGGVAAALLVYTGYLAAKNAIEIVSNGLAVASCLASYAKAAATGAEVSATAAATAAQYGFNTALLACPITWIIVGIIALVALLYIVVAAINKVAGTSYSATGIIVGVLAAAGAFIWNLFATLINFVITCWVTLMNIIGEFANFLGNVFNDPVGAIINLFAGMLNYILGVIQAAAQAVDTLLGSNFASGISNLQNRLDSWADSKTNGTYTDYYQRQDATDYYINRKGYVDSYKAGYNKGSALGINGITGGTDVGTQDYENILNQLENGTGGNALKGIDKNTSSINDKLTNTTEELKLIRQLAERQAVNKITNATIKIDMSGMTNQIKDADRDIDGFISDMTKKLEDAMLVSAEGVHM